MSVFGERIRELRLARRIKLRQFADDLGVNASYVSRVERGESTAPKAEMIGKMALLLRIDVGSEVWTDLLDRAEVSRGKIPDDVLTKSNMELLPAFFARLREQKFESPEEMWSLYMNINRTRSDDQE